MTIGAALLAFFMGLHWYAWCNLVGAAMISIWFIAFAPTQAIMMAFGYVPSRESWAWLSVGVSFLLLGILNTPI